ncbi:MAG TPA: ABC transporter permease [Vicinamibacterales bacterium]|nr:ABC transporter permease [Vicinamibacterales bacterium]
MRAALQRLLALLRRDRLDRELDDEVAAHLELAERDARATGLSAEEARLAARRTFGGLEQVREAHRDARSARSLEHLWRDVRSGLRAIRRTPTVCASIVLILAVTIGANTTMFSAMQAILLRPLAYGNAERLVVVMHGGRSPVSPVNLEDWRRETRSFVSMGAAEYWRPNVGLVDGAERLLALRVSPEMLPLLQVAPAAGRLLDQAPAGADRREVVISHGLWQRRFGGVADAVGQSIRLDGEPYTVVGVMPASFAFAPFWAVGAELWAPLPLAGRPASRGANSLRVFARLAPDVTIAQAQADVDAITSRLEAQFPGTNRNVRVVPLKERVVGDTRLAVIVFMVGVGFVLLIACANVAHMLLARAAGRRREVAVRLALGATRLQIARQFLVESLLLAGVGAAGGVLMGMLGVRALVALAPPDLPRVADVRLDTTVLIFTALVSLLAGIVFGLVPALQAARPAPGEHLKAGRGASVDRRQSALHDLLMVSEIAIALVLLAGAGLMLRTVISLQAIDPGFDARGLLAFSVSVQGTPQAEPSRRAPFFVELTDRLRALPDVASVSAINHLPIRGDLWTRSFAIAGRPLARPGEGPSAGYRVALPDYFATMGMRLVRGRDFTRQDVAGAPDVVIISDNLARHHWPGEEALGQRIVVGESASDPDARWLTVVGIAPDVVRESWEGEGGGEVYLPYLQTHDYLAGTESRYTYLTLVVRGRSGSGRALESPARATVLALDKGASVSDVTTMEEAIGRALARPRFQSTLLALFAGVALMLAAAGVYGVLTHAMARRTREIGLRLALGARREQVRRMVVAQALRRVALGVLVGLIGAAALTRLMSTLLHGVRPGDPATFAGVTALLITVALLASYVPAWRASRLDPMGALRDD